MAASFANFFPAQQGHFRFESGHHGDQWLDLDRLWDRPAGLEPSVAALAARLARYRPEALCGPQTGGARLAHALAARLSLPCFATEYVPAEPATGPSHQARYVLSPDRRAAARNLRVAVVDDVINAGSATRATLAELIACEARPVAVGALLVLNDHAAQLASEHRVALVALDQRVSKLWAPEACPLCEQRVPLLDLG